MASRKSSGVDATTLWAFTPEQVASLTKLSTRQLRDWARTDFYRSSNGPDSYFYSFRDVVALRTISGLRERISLQELRKVGEWLKAWSDTPWASLTLCVGGNKVYLKDPETGVFLARVPKNQVVLPLALDEIANEALSDAVRMRKRRADDIGRINSSRGAPSIAGTRVLTAAVWALHHSGMSTDEILEEYPSLDPKDVKAAVQFERGRHKRSA